MSNCAKCNILRLQKDDADPMGDVISASTSHSPNAVSMLGQRRRRWSNIETTLGECLVFAASMALLYSVMNANIGKGWLINRELKYSLLEDIRISALADKCVRSFRL